MEIPAAAVSAGMLGLALAWFAPRAMTQEQGVPPVVVCGTVVTMHGDAVVDAAVEVRDERAPDKVLCTATTDAVGAFASKRLPGGRIYLVRAMRAGSSVAESPTACPPFPLRLVVFDGITVRGTLRDPDGTPHAGIAMEAVPGLPGAGKVVVTTNADGSFTVPNLPRGRLRLQAVVPGQGLWWCDLRATGDTTVAMARHPGAKGELTLRVDGLAEGLATTTRVELIPVVVNGLPRIWSHRNLLADGTCTWTDLPTWNYRVRLHRPGVHFEPNDVVARPDTELRVATKTARDVAKVQFKIAQAHEAEADAQLVVSTTAGTFRGRWDASGELELDVAPAGAPLTLQVQSTAPTCVFHSARGSLPPTPGQARTATTIDFPMEPCELRLQPANLVRGRVLDPDGKPAASVVVWLVPAQGLDRPLDQPWTRTGADGTFQFPPMVAAGGHWIARGSHANTFAVGDTEIPAVPGESAAADLRLAPNARVEGTVRDADGKPAAGVFVTCVPFDLGTGRLARGCDQHVVTDANGRYAFVRVEAHAVQLRMQADENESRRIGAPFATPGGSTTTRDLVVTR
ncbi:MAG: carboxypeptidase regulatory-like domain-containing protein [Planctomycetes bacterium]|nr:carboxypeptidase regulatory-like domain-containing protein [Planctomycetota bacterium]